ncbi:MAG: type II secretion system protein [Phycisphaeraceae bacterium]
MRRAFTLIELLVVISIITLLIAILLPALARARSAATQTLCLSNIRGLATASHAYAADNRGFFLPGVYQASPQMVEVPGFTVPAGEIQGDRDTWKGYLENYSDEKGSESMYCPFYAGDPLHSFGNGWPNTTATPGLTFFAMGYANYAGTSRQPGRPAWVSASKGPVTDDAPSDMPLFADMMEGNLDGSNWLYYSHAKAGAVGGGNTLEGSGPVTGPDGINTSFVDGSAGFNRFVVGSDEYEVASTGTISRGFIWYYQSRP